MAIALVAHTGAASTDSFSVTTGAIDTSGATLLVMGNPYANPYTASDSKSNTWVVAATVGASAPFCSIQYVKNPTVGSGHTFTISSTTPAAVPSVCVAAFSGTDTTANRDQENTAQNDATTTLAVPSTTPTTANQLLVTVLAIGATASLSIDGGFTIADQVTLVGGLAYGSGLAYLIQTTATAASPTWTSTVSGKLRTGLDTFKASTGGDTSTTQQRMVATQSLIESSGVIGLRWK